MFFEEIFWKNAEIARMHMYGDRLKGTIVVKLTVSNLLTMNQLISARLARSNGHIDRTEIDILFLDVSKKKIGLIVSISIGTSFRRQIVIVVCFNQRKESPYSSRPIEKQVCQYIYGLYFGFGRRE